MKEKIEGKINIRNKKASFEFEFIDTYRAGIMLTGTEIKSIRQSKVNMQDAYCIFKGEELFLVNMQISQYTEGTHYNHTPKRDRKLLLEKKELKKISNRVQETGITIVPVRLFINDRGYAKVEIAVARGKKLYDKRENIKERDVKREMSRNNY